MPLLSSPSVVSHPVIDLFASYDLSAVALLFDVDGTLIELAPSPFEVNVPDELKIALSRLLDLTGGALALVSGRPVVDLDYLFAPLKLPAIGGHGAETRLRVGEGRPAPRVLSEEFRLLLAGAAKFHSGIVIEDKGYSVALHYRLAPHCAGRLRRHIAACRAAFPGEPTELLLGKAMFEVKLPGVNKGDAVRALMTEAPFMGRVPVFIGDDITDEAVFKVMPSLGGQCFSVTRHYPGLAGIFESPRQVRRALSMLAGLC